MRPNRSTPAAGIAGTSRHERAAAERRRNASARRLPQTSSENALEHHHGALGRLVRTHQFAAVQFGARIAQLMVFRVHRDHALTRSAARAKSKRDHDGGDEQDKRYCVIPSHFLLQKSDGEYDEHGYGNRFLNDLQLESGKCAEAQAIGGYGKAESLPTEPLACVIIRAAEQQLP